MNSRYTSWQLYDAFTTRALAQQYAQDYITQGMGRAKVKDMGKGVGRLRYGLYVIEYPGMKPPQKNSLNRKFLLIIRWKSRKSEGPYLIGPEKIGEYRAEAKAHSLMRVFETQRSPDKITSYDLYLGNPYSSRSRYTHKRLAAPSRFDPRSFRVKKISARRKMIVGCPKGAWSPSRGVCKVGTRAQSLLTKKNPWWVGHHTQDIGADVFFTKRKPSQKTHGSKYGYVTGPFQSSKQAINKSFLYGLPTLIKKRNPKRGLLTEIYKGAEMLTAQKGRSSNDPGQKYYHKFTSKPRVIGLPKGAILKVGGRRFRMTRANVLLVGKKDLWKNFAYSRRDFKRVRI